MKFKLPAAAPVLFAVAASLLTSACTTIQGVLDPSNVDYRGASRGPGLDVPPDLVGPKADDRYVVPDRTTGKTFSGYTSERRAQDKGAAGSTTQQADVLPDRDGARIERDGRLRWLHVDQAPDKVWPLLVEFWKSEGFDLPLESPAIGMMETDWSVRREKAESRGLRGVLSAGLGTSYSTAMQDRYRTRVEKAGSGSDIRISHQALEEVVDSKLNDSTIWQPAPSRPDLELEFMRRLMLRLGSTPNEVQREVARVESPRPERAVVVPAAGAVDAIMLREGFDRAWREVGLVIDRIGFTVEDRDRSKGTYFVRYVDLDRRDPRQGTMSRLFSGERKDLSGQRYQIVVQGEGTDNARIAVLGEAGKAPESEEDRRVANRIIALLHERLR